MQQPPSAADLLATVAGVLADEIVPSLSGPVQHHARVAASLVAIVERELRLGAAAEARERDAWTELLHDHGTGSTTTAASTAVADSDELDPDVPLLDLRERAAAALRAGLADDADVDSRVWPLLMASVRDDLSIAKPGHDDWEGD